MNKGEWKELEIPLVASTEETIDKIIKDKSSVSRYGDGEFLIMEGNGIGFQSYSDQLSNRLKEIIISQQKDHIVCVPDVFNDLNRLNDRAKSYWAYYISLNRSRICRLLDMNKYYYDSLMSRFYIDYKDKGKSSVFFKKIKNIWNERDIVIVEGEKSRLGVGNDLFRNSKSIKRIICPSQNAFSKYSEILNEVKKQDKTKLILIALGPTATVMAYDLSIIGYQAIDIGHIDIEYEWFLKRAEYKIPIENKYVNEAVGGDIVGDINNLEYKNQIICSIT